MKKPLLQFCLLALFCALSAVGAQFPLYGSVALDALPAYLAAMLLGGPQGALVGALGHLLSAVLSGFPMTLPLHLVIALEMAGVCFLTGLASRRRRHLPAAVLGFALNALAAPLIVVVWPGMGWPVALALLPFLALGSALNAFVAAGLAYALQKPLRPVLERVL